MKCAEKWRLFCGFCCRGFCENQWFRTKGSELKHEDPRDLPALFLDNKFTLSPNFIKYIEKYDIGLETCCNCDCKKQSGGFLRLPKLKSVRKHVLQFPVPLYLRCNKLSLHIPSFRTKLLYNLPVVAIQNSHVMETFRRLRVHNIGH